jgi:hypothetical protein
MQIHPKAKFLTLVVFIPLYVFTQPYSYKEDSVYITSSAYKILQLQMSKQDFKRLDWKNVKVDTLPEAFIEQLYKVTQQKIKPILAIPAKEDSTKMLFYTEQKDKKYFNWVYLNLINDSGYRTGNIQILSVNNKLLKTWQIKKDRTVLLQTQDSIEVGDKKLPAPLPSIILRAEVADAGNNSSFVMLSAYYLLFNESLGDDDPLSSVYIALDYNALVLNELLGHMNSRVSKDVKLEIEH